MIILRLLIAPVIIIYQSIFLALGQIWANKMRSTLTSLGIIIGVASVTTVIAALSGLKQNVLEKFAGYGANRIFVYPVQPKDGFHHESRDLFFHPRDFDGLLDHCPAVASMTRTCGRWRKVSFGTFNKEVNVLGIEASWHEVTGRPVIVGRPFSLIDNTMPRSVCLINRRTRDTFGLDADPSGQSIMVEDRRFMVVGMIEDQADDPWEGGDRAALELFVPFKIEYHGNQDLWGQVASRSPDLSQEAQAEMQFFFRNKRHLGLTKPDNFEVWAVQQVVDDFQSLAGAITAVASGIVGISLLVGGIGIMNIMLISVSERTREIGLRKAVGARPLAILLQFLVEAIVLCLLGGGVGLLAGEAITMLFKQIPEAKLEKAAIPFWAIALSFGFASAVGLIFGMFPAIKAARLDPIEALRHE
jgi:putative ABC transport system permease protein